MPVKTTRKKKKSPARIVLFVILGLILLGIVAKLAGWIGGTPPVQVNYSDVARRTIIERVTASGTIQPETEVKISPEVPGEIINLYIKEGDSVEQDKLLLRIRPDNYESAVSRSLATLNQQKANLAQSQARVVSANAQLLQVEAAYDRNKDLYDQGVISSADFEVSESNYKVAQQDVRSAEESVQAARYAVESANASVAEAKENLSLTSIFAPVSGIVSKLEVEKGERVVGTSQMAGTEMLRIADLTRMEAWVDVNENDIVRVSLGDTAIVDVDAYTYLDKEFKGVVTAIANTANEKLTDEAVTEFEVRVRLLPESYQDLMKQKGRSPFRPGMTASVDIITQTKDNVLSVPLSAVTTRAQSDSTKTNSPESGDDLIEVVFRKATDESVDQVPVSIGISNYEYIEILDGLKEGDQIVSGPYLSVSKQLSDKAKVTTEKK